VLNYIENMYNRIKPTGFTKHYLTLFAIVEGLETKNSFEFGTGWSTKVILDALKYTGGKHISCDIRKVEDTGLTKEFLKNNINTWTYLQQDSTTIDYDSLPLFDFVLHDGSHIPEIVRTDLLNIFPHIKHNGIILVHDTLFVPELKIVCEDIAVDSWSNMVTLPYGYGLTIINVNNEELNEEIKTTWKK